MPNRILKESICCSDTINKLSPSEEICFYRLLVNCDDYGRCDGRSQILKAKLFPLKIPGVTDKDISNWIFKLQEVGLIKIYAVNEQPYIQVTTWDKHQQIRAKKSKYPSLDNNGLQMIADDRICPRNPNQSESNTNPNPNNNGDIKLPEWIDLKTWDEFMDMRVKIKEPATHRAKELLIRELEKLKAQGHDPNEVMNQSIINNWRGVFPLKNQNTGLSTGDTRKKFGKTNGMQSEQEIEAGLKKLGVIK